MNEYRVLLLNPESRTVMSGVRASWQHKGAFLKLQFITSAVEPKGYPVATKPEVALAGRSNAGKSSLINAIAQSKVAKTSQMPGKTTLLNFFEAGDHYRFVDMPGYGFSKRSGSEQMSWQGLVETYLSTRAVLVGVVLVMDVRREWDTDEELLKQFLIRIDRPLKVVLTKADKLKPREKQARVAAIIKDSGVKDVCLVSSTSREGIETFEEELFEDWIKAKIK